MKVGLGTLMFLHVVAAYLFFFLAWTSVSPILTPIWIIACFLNVAASVFEAVMWDHRRWTASLKEKTLESATNEEGSSKW